MCIRDKFATEPLILLYYFGSRIFLFIFGSQNLKQNHGFSSSLTAFIKNTQT